MSHGLVYAKRGFTSPGSHFVRSVQRLGATDAWDFVDNSYMRDGRVTSNSGISVTRASVGTAETADGRIITFGSGVRRQTDKGLLVEGARTNVFARSQEFDNNTSWTKTNATITANAVAAPDGTLTADKLIETTANGRHAVNQAFTCASDEVFTLSFFAKKAERSWVGVFESTFQGDRFASFNLDAGTAHLPNAAYVTTFQISATISPLADGWYRCSVTAKTPTGTALASRNFFGHIMAQTGETTFSYVGDDTKGVYLWGAQMEQASSFSSYIPTEGSTVTRAVDVVTAVPTSGTDYSLSLFAEFERVVDTGTVEYLVAVDDGDDTDMASLYIAADDTFGVIERAANSLVASEGVSGAVAIATPTKGAARFALNNTRPSRSGVLGNSDTSAAQPATPTRILFGQRHNNFGPSFSYLRRIAIIPRALTDAELQSLTM